MPIFFFLGLLGSLRQSELEQVLLPLTPSAELDDQSPSFDNSNVNTLHSPPDHMDFFAEDFSMGLNADNNSSAFNMNLLAPDLVDNMEGSPSLQCVPYHENFNFDVNFHSCDLTPSSSATSQDGNDVTQDLLTSPSSVFMDDKEQDFGDEDDLHSPLSDLLEDVAMLDDIRLLDLALDEGFSPEMAARLEEEGYLDCEITQQKTGDHSVSGMAVAQDESQPRRHQQGS